ncbi:MAG: DNA mismatch repair endonuclease MutL [Bacteroidetes bacterium]|nr:DNA mismatch repair endonuclease MutL [Bacteroidota bacterium]MDA1223925.1 DNA mismatch repair endonuclease MutL [Bacteroidota bacterium]
MTSVIKLLPDAVANQIAAGEVVQRPANAVKELLENSLDAGATKITLLVKDGGSTLMQVIDNGKGMSEMDARLCWERHATSKIRTAEDLFKLNTYGFRGEAMASIAAVSQVEMKTKRANDEVAQFIRIEGSEVLEQRVDAAPQGTNIAIKNLFYNLPARRNFLKSIAVETKHIVEEFLRQAMANPTVEFVYHNNGSMVYHFKAQPRKDRVLEAMGKKPNTEILEVKENTDIVEITGFVGAPGTAKRTRGEQFFFMNGRFIRSNYFHHAVSAAYEGLIESDEYPLYALYLNVDPVKVDVNVHPTKTEVKFEDEKHIYNLVKAAVRKALGNFVVQPSLSLGDFTHMGDFLNQPMSTQQSNTNQWQTDRSAFTEKRNPNYNPFGEQGGGGYQRSSNQDWQKVLGSVEQTGMHTMHRDSSFNLDSSGQSNQISGHNNATSDPNSLIQGLFPLSDAYLVVNRGGVLTLVDKKLAQQHVFYHDYLKQLQAHAGQSQHLLFPRTVELPPAQIPVVLELLQELQWLGFDISHFGGNTLIVNGLPALLTQGDEQKLIENLIEDYQNTQGDLKLGKYESMALSMARHAVIRSGMGKTNEELQQLATRLFALQNPSHTFDGRPIFIEISAAFIYDTFQNKKQRT